MFSFRYGEIIDINLVRDKSSGKSKGYGFLCYEDQRSTILAVDNFNGIKVKSTFMMYSSNLFNSCSSVSSISKIQ